MPKTSSLLNFDGILLPPFMSDMNEYVNCLEEIAKCNHISLIEEVIDEDPNIFAEDHSNKTLGPFYHF